MDRYRLNQEKIKAACDLLRSLGWKDISGGSRGPRLQREDGLVAGVGPITVSFYRIEKLDKPEWRGRGQDRQEWTHDSTGHHNVSTKNLDAIREYAESGSLLKEQGK